MAPPIALPAIAPAFTWEGPGVSVDTDWVGDTMLSVTEVLGGGEALVVEVEVVLVTVIALIGTKILEIELTFGLRILTYSILSTFLATVVLKASSVN